MGNKVDNRIAYLNGLYQGVWLGSPTELIDIGKFQIDIYFEMDNSKLIEADRLIWKQIKTCRKICNKKSILHSKAFYNQLERIEKALLEVHKRIFRILQTDYRIESCWENNKGELDYLRK